MLQPSWYQHKSNKVQENQLHFHSQEQIQSQMSRLLACWKGDRSSKTQVPKHEFKCQHLHKSHQKKRHSTCNIMYSNFTCMHACMHTFMSDSVPKLLIQPQHHKSLVKGESSQKLRFIVNKWK